jgi:S1-C subfamily serine protease
MDGSLVGLSYSLNQENILIPAEYLKQAVKHLLDNTERVGLGIRYLDMENNSGFIRKGNLIYHPSLRAVEYNSVGYTAGLKAGDQIVSVNNEIISSTNTLTSILQNYRIGDKVVFKILRNEVEQDIEVVL